MQVSLHPRASTHISNGLKSGSILDVYADANPRSASDKHKLVSHLALPFPSLHMYLFQPPLFSCCLLLSDIVHWCASITGTFLTWWRYWQADDEQREREMTRACSILADRHINTIKATWGPGSNNANNNASNAKDVLRKPSSLVRS